jgi:hypothetical protein
MVKQPIRLASVKDTPLRIADVITRIMFLKKQLNSLLEYSG